MIINSAISNNLATPTNSIINELKISAENQIPDSNANNIINPNNINLPLPPPSIHSSNINKETESIYSISKIRIKYESKFKLEYKFTKYAFQKALPKKTKNRIIPQ